MLLKEDVKMNHQTYPAKTFWVPVFSAVLYNPFPYVLNLLLFIKF